MTVEKLTAAGWSEKSPAGSVRDIIGSLDNGRTMEIFCGKLLEARGNKAFSFCRHAFRTQLEGRTHEPLHYISLLLFILKMLPHLSIAKKDFSPNSFKYSVFPVSFDYCHS